MLHRQYFTARLVPQRKPLAPYHFTLKLRLQATESWLWVNDQYSQADGVLCLQTLEIPDSSSGRTAAWVSKAEHGELSKYIENICPSLAIAPVASEAPDTDLWEIGTPVVQGEQEHDYRLGRPRHCSRWFALVRIWTPWLAPRHGRSDFHTTEDAVMCSFLRCDGLHLLFLAISGIDDVLTLLKSGPGGQIHISARSDRRQDPGKAIVLAAVGRTFESVIAAVMYHARKLVAGRAGATADKVQTDVRAQWLENWYDGLSYCTWNGLGQALTEQKIHNALNALRDHEIHG